MPGRTLGSEELAELAVFLRCRDFPTSTAQLLAARRLLWRMADLGISKPGDELVPWLAPIFATSELELKRFADLYRQFRAVSKANHTPSRRSPRWIWLASVAVVIAAIAGIFWGFASFYRVTPKKVNNATVVNPGGAPQPRKKSPENSNTLTVTGVLRGDDGKAVSHARILYGQNDPVESGENGQFKITGVASQPVLATSCNYDAVLFPLADSENPPPMVRKPKTGCIPDKSSTSSGSRAGYQRLRLAVSTLPFVAFVAWTAYVLWRRAVLKKWRGSARSAFARLPDGDSADGLFPDSAVQKSVQELQRPRPTSLLEMWPERTVTATVENAGWFSPVYRARQRTGEYLVLVDRRSKRDHQASFAAELVSCLKVRGVTAHVRYFNSDPRTCTEPETGKAVALTELVARYGGCQVWLVADGSGFFSTFTGRLERWVDTFQQWPARVLLTPAIPSDWGDRERRLSDAGFEILPATPRGLARIIDHLSRPENALESFPSLLEDRAARWTNDDPPSSVEITRLRTELRLYLGRDGLRWLTACAEYPVIEWPLTLYLGRALMTPDALEPTLRKLIRLPWFRRGSMPDWLRAALVGVDKKFRLRVRDLLSDRLNRMAYDGSDATVGVGALQMALDRQYHRKFEEDEVWLSLLWGREPIGLALPAGRLRNLLFERGLSWLGPRPLTLTALMMSCGIWWLMGFGMPRAPAEPRIEPIALDIATSQYHNPGYFNAAYQHEKKISFPVWCYNVAQLVLNRSILLVPAQARVQIAPGMISRDQSTYGVIADSESSFVSLGGVISTARGLSVYEVGEFSSGPLPRSPPVPVMDLAPHVSPLGYGFIKGVVISSPVLKSSRHKLELQYHIHVLIQVESREEGYQQWDAALNIGTNDADDLVLYRLVYNYSNPLINLLRAAPAGYNDRTGQTSLPSLDFLRSNVLFDTGKWRDSDVMDGSDLTEPVSSIMRLLEKARSSGATVYIFGRTYTDGVQGIHDVHMNQGSGGSFLNNGKDNHNDHNDIWQDGALIVDLGGPQMAAFFLAFAQQNVPTDDLGNPAEGSHPIANNDPGSQARP